MCFRDKDVDDPTAAPQPSKQHNDQTGRTTSTGEAPPDKKSTSKAKSGTNTMGRSPYAGGASASVMAGVSVGGIGA